MPSSSPVAEFAVQAASAASRATEPRVIELRIEIPLFIAGERTNRLDAVYSFIEHKF
jgi:hypothetical protein